MRVNAWTRRVAFAVSVAAGALCVAVGAPSPLQAQGNGAPLPDNVAPPPPPPPLGADAALDSARAARGAMLQFTLYTYGPGDEVFERFGHIALAVTDANTGEDTAFNWGMFDFESPDFYTRFLTGDTRYWMAGYRTFEFNAAYQAQNRTIRKQVLNLSPVQRGALYDFVAWNAAEANKYYRYDYYNDNCSTSVRDALDWVWRGALRTALDSTGGHHTWRGETARITADNLPVYAGIQIALGRNADRHLTRWQLAFLPEYFADDLARIRVNGASVITQDTVLFTADRIPMPEDAPDRVMPYLAVGLALGVLVFVLGRVSPAALGVFGVAWYGAGGLLGTALLLAGTVTKHVPYMGSNLNLTILSPLLLAAAATWYWRGRASRAGRAGRALAVVVAVIALVGLVLMHFPGFTQGSMLLFMTMVPVHTALAIAASGRRSAA
ncbi:DUF4105 domain-containing protein [Gemmatimonas sp.]|jgi:hypothetical protein|uniref:lipoprotein N-acyltransferase Lnb domain-containing protein n=1 Tax=Gemmatimonas sp. TaxID=1962908 RepID=UPI0037BFDB77